MTDLEFQQLLLKYRDGTLPNPPRRRKPRGPKPTYCPKATKHRNCGWCGQRFETGRLTGNNAATFCHRNCKNMNRRWRKTHPGFSTRQEYLEKTKND